MSQIIRVIFVFCFLTATASNPAFSAENNLLQNGGFEQGLKAPWGIGQYGSNGLWWNAGDCQSTANIDFQTSQSGRASLHISNSSGSTPNVYGTTVQAVAIQPSHKYRITLWAKGKSLASKGAISLIVDKAWYIRPIMLPSGTFDWQKFDGIFELKSTIADIRILSQDRGEVWIDDISVTLATDDLATPILKINNINYEPAPVSRGSAAKIIVEYSAPASDMSVPVVEEWTLMFDDKPVMPSFKQEFEVRKDHNRHEFILPIPTVADLGRYKMKLHVTSSGRDADGQVWIDVKE
ncbi:MAG: carbohydrate binding domain-containing protein [Candidatus Nitrotoga sp.]|nr:carbohydrate binding domain-containing protein [Candidatus Nitrotoga sp.]